jgi:hypothetical protein
MKSIAGSGWLQKSGVMISALPSIRYPPSAIRFSSSSSSIASLASRSARSLPGTPA